MPTLRTILHVDMDAFYASAELLRRPDLRGKPVVVGGAGRRGVVAAASYEARYYGVRSAMPSTRARQLCPAAIFLAGDHDYYRELSGQIMAIMARYTPMIEPLSLDEAFLDVTAANRLFGNGRAIANELRAAIHAEVGLWCSAGAAPNKFLAKLASEHAKPSASLSGPVPGAGVYVVEPGQELAFLHPLPARSLWGVGPATMAKLDRLGIATVGDLAAMPVEAIVAALGKAVGRHLHELATGRDDRAVEPHQRPKSISQEETFEYDRRDRTELERHAMRMSDSVAARLRGADLSARTVTIKVRFGDFTTITRSSTLADATGSAPVIFHTARKLLEEVDVGRGIRLLGVGATGLDVEHPRQLSLDDVVSHRQGAGWRQAEAAVDEIRRRFGTSAIGPAVLIEPGEGLKTRERNENPWG